MSDVLYPILFSSIGAIMIACCVGSICVRRYRPQPVFLPPVQTVPIMTLPAQAPHPVSPMSVPVAYPVTYPVYNAAYTVYERPPAYNPHI